VQLFHSDVSLPVATTGSYDYDLLVNVTGAETTSQMLVAFICMLDGMLIGIDLLFTHPHWISNQSVNRSFVLVKYLSELLWNGLLYSKSEDPFHLGRVIGPRDVICVSAKMALFNPSLLLWLQLHAWEVADQLLLLKRDMETSYFASQTMQSKIRFSFEELPPDTHVVSRISSPSLHFHNLSTNFFQVTMFFMQ